MENYISVVEIAQKWGLSARRVCTLCTEGRIPGAVHFVRVWAIPKDAEKLARDTEARAEFKQEKARQSIEDEAYILDIIRGRWQNDDPRIQRILLG